jgi:hypothetical protein
MTIKIAGKKLVHIIRFFVANRASWHTRFVAVRSSKQKIVPTPPFGRFFTFGYHETSFLLLLVQSSKPTIFSTNLSKHHWNRLSHLASFQLLARFISKYAMEWKIKTFSANKTINALISPSGTTLTPNNQYETVIAQLESTECCCILILKQAIPGASSSPETRQLQRRQEMKMN